MDKAKRKAIIAGNWKMNKTASEAAVLVDELIPAVKDASCEVVICTPYTDLVTAVAKTKGTNIHVGAENVHFEKSGAFTGEISADMLTDLGVEYVVIAYEPIWAIGTGKTATADQAEEVCAQIRKVIGEVYGEAVAEATTVQYGGSMNAKNCEELLSKKDVDGGLIGGASLKAPDFAVIVNAATKG